MSDENDRPLRYSNYFLKLYADGLEQSIKVKMKYQHITDAKEELLLELVRRELERTEPPKGEEDERC